MCKASSPFRKKRSKEGKSNNPKCLFCGAVLDKPMNVRGGGRASFCDSCAKLKKGRLRVQGQNGRAEETTATRD